MGQFEQFELNGFKRSETHFGQLHISLYPDELESFVCSLIAAMRGFAKLHVLPVIARSVPKKTSNIDAYYMQICQIFV